MALNFPLNSLLKNNCDRHLKPSPAYCHRACVSNQYMNTQNIGANYFPTGKFWILRSSWDQWEIACSLSNMPFLAAVGDEGYSAAFSQGWLSNKVDHSTTREDIRDFALVLPCNVSLIMRCCNACHCNGIKINVCYGFDFLMMDTSSITATKVEFL